MSHPLLLRSLDNPVIDELRVGKGGIALFPELARAANIQLSGWKFFACTRPITKLAYSRARTSDT